MMILSPVCMEKANNEPPKNPRVPKELNQTCGETFPMWRWTIDSAPILAIFSPSSNPCGAAMKLRRSQSPLSKCHSVSKKSTGVLTEVEEEYPTSRSGSDEKSHFLSLPT